MNIPKINGLCKQAKILVKENGPLLCIITAGIGFTGAIGTTAKATIKAVRRTDYETEKKGAPLTKKELFDINWRFYTVSALLWTTSIISLCFAVKGYDKGAKRFAALYAATEAAKKELEEAALSKLGEKQYIALQDEVAKRRMETDPVDKKPIYETGHGDSLCYDTLSGRYFRCSPDQVRRGVNNFNKHLLTNEALSYNELMYDISIGELEDIGFGEDVGWNIKDGLLEVRYSSQLAKNGEPCLVLSFPQLPIRGYYK